MPAPTPSPVFQIGIVVPDLGAAMEELGIALGVTWGTVQTFRVGDWVVPSVFSREGPPHIEVVQGPAGSPWDASSGPRLDHLQRWTTDLDGDVDHLAEAGLSTELDGRELGLRFAYLRGPGSGVRIELIADAVRARHRAGWGLDDERSAP